MQNKKVLICGATGFIGRNMVNFFSNLPGYEVHAVNFRRPPYKLKDNLNKVFWHKADLRSPDDVKNVVSGMDIIIQAAATTSGAKDIVTKPYIHVTDNAVMNSLLLRESFEQKVSHFIFFSCTVMYQSSSNGLRESDWDGSEEIHPRYFGVGNTKVYIEKMLEFFSRISDMKTTAIRHSNIYGPYDKFDLEKSHVFGATVTKAMTASKNLTVWGTGEEERDLLHVEDLCNFVKTVIDNQSHNYRLYNCGYGEKISIKSLVNSIVESTGKDLVIDHDLSQPTIKTSLFLDCNLAMRELSWKPQIKIKDGIQSTVDWWKENIDPETLKLKETN